MTMPDDPFADAACQVLADQCPPAVVRAIENHGRAAPETRALWSHLERSGLADALLPEEQGGAGLMLAQVFGVLEQCGAHVLPLPLAETMLARALLAACGVPQPAGSVALARGELLSDGGLHCALVRGGVVAATVLVQAGDVWYLLPVDSGQTKPQTTPQAAPQAFALDAALTWTAAQVNDAPCVLVASSSAAVAVADIRTLHAAVVAAQMSGALMVVFQRTLEYANTREQFGRHIGKFQAIQHQLAVMSEQVCAARMAAQIGCNGSGGSGGNGSDNGIWPDRLRVATAKARCSEAALVVAQTAHAIHGAIGFTEEYDLQLFTRRLHAWRQTAGSEAYWHDVAGAALLGHAGMTLDVVRRITDVQSVVL